MKIIASSTLLLTLFHTINILFCSAQFYNISDKSWNSEYASGKWKYIKTVAVEKARNSVIAVYIDSYSQSNATILDVGCGEGVLRDFLPRERRPYYHGVDFSEIAIDNAKKITGSSNFTVASVETFSPTKLFDVVVFNEMLYYTDHRAMLLRYKKFLAPGGSVVVSVFFKTNVNVIMQTIFKDVARSFRWKLDEITLQGSTQKNDKWKSVPVSFQIGIYKLR